MAASSFVSHGTSVYHSVGGVLLVAQKIISEVATQVQIRTGPLIESVPVFHCFTQYFCLHFEAFQLGMAPVYMAFLRFMGDEIEARKYNQSLEVGGYGIKLTWDGPPRNIRDSHRKVRDSHDGLIIQRKLALFFSRGDMKKLKLRVTGRIFKGDYNSDSGTSF